MTKKNLKPQQTAPVQREINTASSEAAGGLTPLVLTMADYYRRLQGDLAPFAGDDAG